MNYKNQFFVMGLLLIVIFSLSAISAQDNASNTVNIENNIDNEHIALENDTCAINNYECNNEKIGVSQDNENLRMENSENDLISCEVKVNEELEPQSGGKTFTEDYFGQKVNVYLTSEEISSLKKGIGFECLTGELVKVQSYKKVVKTVKKPVKKTVFVAKINKYTGKVKWSSKYFGKTIKYALKYKYKGTYKKTKGKYIRVYQKYKGYKKVKKTTYKRIWAKKELIVTAFKVSKDGQYQKGYYLQLSFDGADREGCWDYKINI